MPQEYSSSERCSVHAAIRVPLQVRFFRQPRNSMDDLQEPINQGAGVPRCHRDAHWEAKKVFGTPSPSTILLGRGDRNSEMQTDSPEPTPQSTHAATSFRSASPANRTWQSLI